jgi:hypothetical protein
MTTEGTRRHEEASLAGRLAQAEAEPGGEMMTEEIDYTVHQLTPALVKLWDIRPGGRLVAAAADGPGGWRVQPSELPMPWEMTGRRFGTAAEALTAQVPYAVTAGHDEAGLCAAIAAFAALPSGRPAGGTVTGRVPKAGQGASPSDACPAI